MPRAFLEIFNSILGSIHEPYVLEQVQWKISGKNSAAEILDLDRSSLRARMRKHNIRKP